MDSKDSEFSNQPPDSTIKSSDSNLLHAAPKTLPPNQKRKLLIVEDDSSVATPMKWVLAEDYEVLLAEDRATAMDLFKRETPSVVTLDLGLPPYPLEVREGFAALNEMLSHDGFAKIIVITGRGEKDHALKAIGQGAYDFFSKPIQVDELKVVLQRAFYVSRLERENRELQAQSQGEPFAAMIGASLQIQEVFASIRKVAGTDVPVLITGESGTGKELVAKAVHQLSTRKTGPFVVINCSAIPETLLESELFGHEKGAFTGAHIQRKGRFETAQGGTLLLDEIGELSLPLQVKLLRFLQEQIIERVGGREEIFVDVRVVAATNRDLMESIKLLDVVEANVVEIAGNWAACVKKDKWTVHYHDIPKEKLMPQAIKFYNQLRSLLVEPDRFEKAHEFFQQYAETCYNNNIPLHESVYALNVMRRHMWLHAEFQTIFINALAHHQAVDSLIRIMLMMDYAMVDITQYYQDRMQQN